MKTSRRKNQRSDRDYITELQRDYNRLHETVQTRAIQTTPAAPQEKRRVEVRNRCLPHRSLASYAVVVEPASVVPQAQRTAGEESTLFVDNNKKPWSPPEQRTAAEVLGSLEEVLGNEEAESGDLRDSREIPAGASPWRYEVTAKRRW